MSNDFMYDDEQIEELKEGACPEGPHDFTIKKAEFKLSSSNNPMAVIEFAVDKGEDAGHVVVQRFSWDGPSAYGIKLLKKISVLCGFKMQVKPDMHQYVGQFVGYRIHADVVHRYTIKSGGGYKDVDKQEFDEYDGDGEKGIFADLRRFDTVKSKKPDITFEVEKDPWDQATEVEDIDDAF